MEVLSRTELMGSAELFQLGSTVLLFPGAKTNRMKKSTKKLFVGLFSFVFLEKNRGKMM